MSVTGRLAPCLTTFADDGFDPQRPCDVSIVMPTVVRETIADALQSVFRKDLDGRIQVLIGIDRPAGDIGLIEEACGERPSHCCVQVFYPGYSTSSRHGGAWTSATLHEA